MNDDYYNDFTELGNQPYSALNLDAQYNEILQNSYSEGRFFADAGDNGYSLEFTKAITVDNDNRGSIYYVEVTAKTPDEADKVLYTYNEDTGKYEGSMDRVEQFARDHFRDGFYTMTFEEKNDQIERMDEDGIDPYVEEHIDEISAAQTIDETIEKADIPDDLGDLKHPIFEADSFNVALSHSFIPFELREGYEGRVDEAFSQESVDFIRKEYDPEFGKVIGIDTSRFDTGEGGNIKVYENIPFESIKRYSPNLTDGDAAKFTDDNIEYINAYKEYGDSFKVQGEDFHPFNLLTVEIKVKDEDVPYRNTVIIDDVGYVKEPLDIQDKPGIFTPDRDNSFDVFDDHKMPGPERTAYMNEVYAKVGKFTDQFLDKIDKSVDDRRPLQEARLEKFEADKEGIKSTINKLELFREIQYSKVAGTEQRLDSAAKDLRMVYEKIDGINDKTTADEKSEIIKERNQLTSHVSNLYHSYMKETKDLDIPTTNNVIEKLKGFHAEASSRVDAQSTSIKAIFSYETVFEDHLQVDSFRDWKIDGQSIGNSDKILLLRGAIDNKADGYPMEANITSAVNQVLAQTPDLMERVDSTIQGAIDKYNEGVSDLEKVHMGEDGYIYTDVGMKIEPELSPADGTRFELVDKESPYPLYNDKEVKVVADGVLAPENTSKTDKPSYSEMSLDEYLGKTIDTKDGNKITQGEVGKQFLEKTIYKGIKPREFEFGSRHNPIEKAQGLTINYEPKAQRYMDARFEVIDRYIDRDTCPKTKEMSKEIEGVIKEHAKESLDDENKVDNNSLTSEDGYKNNARVDDNTNDRDDVDKTDENDNEDKKGSSKKDGISKIVSSKVDGDKDVKISNERLEQLKAEAKKEAGGDVVKEKQILNEKTDKVTKELNDIKDKISKAADPVNKNDKLPKKFQRSDTIGQVDNIRFHRLVKDYINAGGAVGKGEYCVSEITALDSFSNALSFMQSNIFETAVIRIIRAVVENNTKNDVEKPERDNLDNDNNPPDSGSDFNGKPDLITPDDPDESPDKVDKDDDNNIKDKLDKNDSDDNKDVDKDNNDKADNDKDADKDKEKDVDNESGKDRIDKDTDKDKVDNETKDKIDKDSNKDRVDKDTDKDKVDKDKDKEKDVEKDNKDKVDKDTDKVKDVDKSNKDNVDKESDKKDIDKDSNKDKVDRDNPDNKDKIDKDTDKDSDKDKEKDIDNESKDNIDKDDSEKDPRDIDNDSNKDNIDNNDNKDKLDNDDNKDKIDNSDNENDKDNTEKPEDDESKDVEKDEADNKDNIIEQSQDDIEKPEDTDKPEDKDVDKDNNDNPDKPEDDNPDKDENKDVEKPDEDNPDKPEDKDVEKPDDDDMEKPDSDKVDNPNDNDEEDKRISAEDGQNPDDIEKPDADEDVDKTEGDNVESDSEKVDKDVAGAENSDNHEDSQQEQSDTDKQADDTSSDKVDNDDDDDESDADMVDKNDGANEDSSPVEADFKPDALEGNNNVDNTAIDNMVADNSSTDNSDNKKEDFKEELKDSLENFLKGDDDKGEFLDKLVNGIADGDISPFKVMDVVKDAVKDYIVDVLSDALGVDLEPVAEILSDISSIMHGDIFTLIDIMSDFLSGQGLGDVGGELESKVADYMESGAMEIVPNDFGTMGNIQIDPVDGVTDSITGATPDISSDFSGIEGVANEVELNPDNIEIQAPDGVDFDGNFNNVEYDVNSPIEMDPSQFQQNGVTADPNSDPGVTQPDTSPVEPDIDPSAGVDGGAEALEGGAEAVEGIEAVLLV